MFSVEFIEEILIDGDKDMSEEERENIRSFSRIISASAAGFPIISDSFLTDEELEENKSMGLEGLIGASLIAKETPEAVSEPTTEAVSEPTTEAVSEPTTEAVSEPTTETVSEPTTETVTEKLKVDEPKK